MANKMGLSGSALAALLALAAGNAVAEDYQETLYTLSNDAGANAVWAFAKGADGKMARIGAFETGGLGTGQGLGNQGPLAFSANHRYLFAVNAGSNEVSVFRVHHYGLELLDVQAEPGKTPVSIAVGDDLVYVANAGDDSIYGYRFDAEHGKLIGLDGSHQLLSNSASGVAQISFDHDRDALVLTEKAVNKITSFTLDANGLPGNQQTFASAGATPFGFAFGKHNRFFVSEAEGGQANGATVSAYQLAEDGSVTLLDGAVAAGQTAACWLATTPNGKLAFTADTPANAISAFAVGHGGKLSLLQSKAATENHPTDLAVSPDGDVLYTLSGGDHSIGVYHIGWGGKLVKTTSLKGLPAAATGLVSSAR